MVTAALAVLMLIFTVHPLASTSPETATSSAARFWPWLGLVLAVVTVGRAPG